MYEPRPEEEDTYKRAFQSFIKIYDKDIWAGKAFETSTLLASHRSLLEGKVPNASNYCVENLNTGLVNFMVTQLVF